MYPAGNERKTAVAELIRKSQQSTSKFNNWLQSASNLTAASFVVSLEIMKSGKPFTDGEYIKKCFIGMSEHLFSEFKNKTEIINKIKDIPLSATTVRNRAVRMAENVTEQQFSDLKSSPVFSLACDESGDVKNIAQLTLMGRYVSSTGVHEELLGLLPLKGQTRGEDICTAITEFCKEKKINLDKLISLCTDGSPNMVGKYKRFVTLFGQNVKHELLSFHCIVHQEALCAQTFPVEINQVMALVVKIINKIIASALNHRQFRALLDEVNARYKDLLMFNNVRWLSRGAVLKRFTDCFEPIKDFLTNKGINYPELCDDMWLLKLYFAVDLTSSQNHLNKKLQDKGNTAHTLLETALSFEQQLKLFSEDIDSGNFDHFESLKEYTDSSGCIIDLEYFKSAIQSMKNSFSRRFEDFRKYKSTLKFLTLPLIAETGQINFPSLPSVNNRLLALQLIELKTKDLWSTKFENLKTDIENLEREKGFLAANHKWTELAKCQKEEQVSWLLSTIVES
ncbi:general transcription factor II-I repeat domain-containing protein 2-like [Melanaphis sacchari]|uniref:general transcription factor II-I repeat domain-containing protein 2-like n=1 Tax=Melanaphis sacchari TaxID=742174 RepID=UPI000DC145C6|nr:general transcription factor II-I repeat domain-containing protein 2-like [Melanaphis sacchari]